MIWNETYTSFERAQAEYDAQEPPFGDDEDDTEVTDGYF